MPLNHVISSSGSADLILTHAIRRLHVLPVEEKRILNLVSLIILHVLHEALKGVLIAQGRKTELSQLPYMDAGMQRSDIVLRCSAVSICVAGCQERELKARLCIVPQSSRSIWAEMK